MVNKIEPNLLAKLTFLLLATAMLQIASGRQNGTETASGVQANPPVGQVTGSTSGGGRPPGPLPEDGADQPKKEEAGNQPPAKLEPKKVETPTDTRNEKPRTSTGSAKTNTEGKPAAKTEKANTVTPSKIRENPKRSRPAERKQNNQVGASTAVVEPVPNIIKKPSNVPEKPSILPWILLSVALALLAAALGYALRRPKRSNSAAFAIANDLRLKEPVKFTNYRETNLVPSPIVTPAVTGIIPDKLRITTPQMMDVKILDRSLPVLTIGSLPGMNIVISDPSIRPHHASLERTAEGWILKDVMGEKSIEINGQLAASVVLVCGLPVKIGNVNLEGLRRGD